MINRVFCYSKAVAKKNGNKLPIVQLVLLTIIFIVGIIVLAMISNSAYSFVAMMILFITLLISTV